MSGESEWDAMMAWLSTQRCPAAALARDHLVRLADIREALIDRDAEVNQLRAQIESNDGRLMALGAVLDVAGRVARNESKAHELLERAIDSTGFRNLMSTMYGLGPVGEVLPPKQRRSAKAASKPPVQGTAP